MAGEKRKGSKKKEAATPTKKPKKGFKKNGEKKAARGKSAFIFFTMDERPKVVKEFPDMAFGDVGKVVGERWRALSDKAKAPYQALAEKDKAAAAKKNTAGGSTKKK